MVVVSGIAGTTEGSDQWYSCYIPVLPCGQLRQMVRLLPSLQDAACWLRKARLLEPSVEERAEVLKQMARAVQLLSARVSLSDSADGQKPAQQLPLVAPWASRDPEDDETRAVDASSDASGVDFRCALTSISCWVACITGGSALGMPVCRLEVLELALSHECTTIPSHDANKGSVTVLACALSASR